MKGYKAFNSDLTCRGFTYEIGKTYVHDGDIVPCESGFHFCKTIADCYSFYKMSNKTRICKVKAIGNIKTDDGIKYCTDKIVILSEVKNPKLKSNTSACNSGYRNSGNYNSGCGNSGYRNSGNMNSGDYNTGNFNSSNYNTSDYNSGCGNSGNYNSGNCNSGKRNSGDRNSGSKNAGDYNSGDRNTGDYNSGDYNTGDWNSGNFNSGIFNTEKNPTIKIFDKESDWTINYWIQSKAYRIMRCCPYSYSCFIFEKNMTDEEKESHPEYKTIGGFTKIFEVSEDDRQKWWDSLREDEKQAVKELPNFDPIKFKECTGIEV